MPGINPELLSAVEEAHVNICALDFRKYLFLAGFAAVISLPLSSYAAEDCSRPSLAEALQTLKDRTVALDQQIAEVSKAVRRFEKKTRNYRLASLAFGTTRDFALTTGLALKIWGTAVQLSAKQTLIRGVFTTGLQAAGITGRMLFTGEVPSLVTRADRVAAEEVETDVSFQLQARQYARVRNDLYASLNYFYDRHTQLFSESTGRLEARIEDRWRTPLRSAWTIAKTAWNYWGYSDAAISVNATLSRLKDHRALFEMENDFVRRMSRQIRLACGLPLERAISSSIQQFSGQIRPSPGIPAKVSSRRSHRTGPEREYWSRQSGLLRTILPVSGR